VAIYAGNVKKKAIPLRAAVHPDAQHGLRSVLLTPQHAQAPCGKVSNAQERMQ